MDLPGKNKLLLYAQLCTNTGNSVSARRRSGACHALAPASHGPSANTCQRHRTGCRRGWRFALTFARFLGHLKLDKKLLQLLSYCRRSDKTLVIQEMFLTPLRVFIVLQGNPDRGGVRESRQVLDHGYAARCTVSPAPLCLLSGTRPSRPNGPHSAPCSSTMLTTTHTIGLLSRLASRAKGQRRTSWQLLSVWNTLLGGELSERTTSLRVLIN